MNPDPRIDKLPKWAQQRLHVLESDAAYWKAKATAGPADSNTFINSYPKENRTPLGKDARISFVLSTDEHGWERDIQVRIDGDALYVYGADSLAVLPQSSNTFRVRFAR